MTRSPRRKDAQARAAARDLLRFAVARVERGRGAMRRTDPREAVALWRGLVNGTWSLVDLVDSGGRRFVLARQIPPGVTDRHALGPRERAVAAYAAMGHSNKYIASVMGIAPSTVAIHLRSAQRKLGFVSRNELIRLLGGGVRPRGASPPAAPDPDPEPEPGGGHDP